jgi:hypothetical protein
MGLCTVCSQSAGMFRSMHPDCKAEIEVKAQKEAGVIAQNRAALNAFLENGGDVIEGLARPLVLDCFVHRVARLACASGNTEWDKIPHLGKLVTAYDIQEGEVEKSKWFQYIQLLCVDDLNKNQCPERMNVTVPFSFEKGERLAWAWTGVIFAEEQTVRTGSSYGGLSLRVAPGLYVHGGQSAPRSATGLVPLDQQGVLAVTDRALYYKGVHHLIKLKYKNLISFNYYIDGVGVWKEAESAKEQVFIVGDDHGWFAYCLVASLAEVNKKS